MEAIKIRSNIPESRQLTLPPEVPTGDAEIIILYTRAPGNSEGLMSFLDHLDARTRVGREKEDIDQQLLVERSSWE